MEWIKLRSLRSTWWTLALTIAAAIGIAVAVGAQSKAHTADLAGRRPRWRRPRAALDWRAGGLVMTSEYTSGLIRSTFTAAPKRSLVLTAKAAVFGTVSLVVGETASFSAFLAGRASLSRTIASPALGRPSVLRAVVLAGAGYCLIGLIGVGLAAIIRHTPGRGRRPRGWGLCRGDRTRWALEIGWELRAGQHRRQLTHHHEEVGARLVARGRTGDVVPVRRPRPRHRRVAAHPPRCVSLTTMTWGTGPGRARLWG